MKKEEKIMKTKKIVIGAMAATMLSLSVCSLVPAAAAGETVQISVSEATAKAGGDYTVEVSLADIPSTGIQALNFSIEYDGDLISIDSVKAGAATNTGKSDSIASQIPEFSTYTDTKTGLVSVMWTTSLSDASYWLKQDGVFCTISGKVKSGVADGKKAAIKLVATPHDTYPESGVAYSDIDCGYLKGKEMVQYAVKVTNGGVNVGTTATTAPAQTVVLGDANCDGKVTLGDSLAILQFVANETKYPLSDQGLLNADCDGVKGITANDSVWVQEYDVKHNS
jgi:hypothetical protein